MSKKNAFISEVNGMMNSLGYEWESDDAKIFWEALITQKDEDKPMFTDNGKLVLKYMQENSDVETWTSKALAEGIGITSRTVSGSLRKLVTDGFADKAGQSPVVYMLTKKGKEIEIK